MLGEEKQPAEWNGETRHVCGDTNDREAPQIHRGRRGFFNKWDSDS